jgi:thiol-disulfide isomerase/thioredoxin
VTASVFTQHPFHTGRGVFLYPFGHNMHLTSMDQKQFLEKAEASGKPTVVDFWAPWCAPCRMTKPILEKLAKEYHDEVNFWPVNADEQQGPLQELKIYRRTTRKRLSSHVRSAGKWRDSPNFHLSHRPLAAPGSRYRHDHLHASIRDLVAAPAGTADPVHRRV